MTIQQLEYIVAVEQYGYFVTAAEVCGVTQSTLSLMVKKLEEELDVRIFNRDTHPVTATEIGKKVIAEAKLLVFHARQITELTSSEKEICSGDLSVAVTATVAPVLMPGMFKYMRQLYPDIRLRMEEMITATIINKIKKADIDMGILNYPVDNSEILEIPLYHERFFAYVSPNDSLSERKSFGRKELLDLPLWTMKEGVGLFDQTMFGPGEEVTYDRLYEGGRVGILIQIVNENGGLTIIPETHLNFLSESMRACLRPIINPVPQRTICLAVRKDFIHEKMMNIVIKAIKTLIPTEMFDSMIRTDYLRL